MSPGASDDTTGPSGYAAVRELVASVRDVRRFRGDPVPPEVIDELVAAATARVPERFAEAPWRFVAVVGAERERLVTRVAEALGRHWGLGPAPTMPRGLALHAILDAPVLLLVFSRIPATEGLEGVAVVAAAAHSLILLARARGLATHRTFAANLVPEAVVDFAAEHLGSSIRTAEMVGMLAVGHPEAPPEPTPSRGSGAEWVGLTGAVAVAAEVDPLPAAPRPSPELRSPGGELVYVVDPYRHNRESLTRSLEAAGYLVETFGDGTSLLGRAVAALPDLYVVNDELPDITGFELVRTLAGPGVRPVPVLLTTARPDAAFRIGGLAAGVSYYLRRPVNATELYVAARILLERARLVEQLQGANDELSRLLGELRAAQGHLVQQAKMASLGELVAGVAHEINTPLGAVISNTELFLRVFGRLRDRLAALERAASLPDRDASPRDLEAVVELTQVSLVGCRRIAEIVRSLRTFARPDEGGLQLVDVTEGLESTLALVRHLLGPSIEVQREYAELPRVECRPGQLNQVFMNLLVNAIQAIDGPGVIRVRTWADARHVYVAVADNGCGIPAEQLARIFDPGFTTKGAGIGTGLGLSISYQIVAAHGGEITVESKVGEGSTFVVALPRTEGTPAPPG
jgi:two-component system NtrC family sensor kinase